MLNSYIRLTDLKDYICGVMGIKTITPIINNQITRYLIEDNLTVTQIYRAIKWYVEVEKNTINPIYGISFVKNIVEIANKYYAQLELEQLKREQEAKKLEKYQANNIVFRIKNLKTEKRKPKQINIDEIDVKGDDDDEHNSN